MSSSDSFVSFFEKGNENKEEKEKEGKHKEEKKIYDLLIFFLSLSSIFLRYLFALAASETVSNRRPPLFFFPFPFEMRLHISTTKCVYIVLSVHSPHF